jgi:hypothetical protein
MSLPLIPEKGLTNEEAILRLTRTVNNILRGAMPSFLIQDGIAAPQYAPGKIVIYVDVADGDLKVVFGDGTVKTIVIDT